MNKNILITVIIPAHNEELLLPTTLENVKTVFEKLGISYETIVVDNASDDCTKEVARKFDAKVVFQPIRSIAQTRNAGASNARDKYLLFLDADTQISTKIITKALIQLRQSDIRLVSCITGFDKYNLFSLGVWLYNFLSILFKLGVGQFIFISKSDFLKIGGFDHDKLGFEDIYFVRKVKSVFGRTSVKILPNYVLSSARKFDNLSQSTTFVLQLLAVLLGKEINQNNSNLRFWYQSENSKKSNYKLLILFLLFLLFSVNHYLVIINAPTTKFEPIVLPVLFLLVLVVLVSNWKHIDLFINIFCITMLLEIIGMYLGVPFGNYYYNYSYGVVGLLGVPFFIGMAWVILLVCISNISNSSLTVGLLTLGIDIMLEKFATINNYWLWLDKPFITNNFDLLTAPIQNYFTWVAISLIFYYFFKNKNYKFSLFYTISILFLIIGYIFTNLLLNSANFIILFMALVALILASGINKGFKMVGVK